MIKEIQKAIEFYREAFKINGMAFAWDVFDIRDKEIILDAIKHSKIFGFLNCSWRDDAKLALRAIQLYAENVFLPTTPVINLKTQWLGKTKFYKLNI